MDITTTRFGSERQPLVIIDDFVPVPHALVDDAAMLAFRPIGAHYPGVRAEVAPALVARFLDPVCDLIADTFGLAQPFAGVECCYSIVTTRPGDLAPIQRLPHFDSVDPCRIALLHYLMSDAAGGTRFFRHRATGFESVDAARLATYENALAADIAAHGVPDPAYIAGDTALFAEIGRVDARWNRAVLYRGNTLHCADIPPGLALSADPEAGRLTVNSFITGKPLP